MALASWMLLADEPQPEEISVAVGRHQMRCLKTGSGPSLVLVHGLLGAAESWWPCLSRLSRHSTVFAVDALSIGRSDRVPGLDASLIAQADRLAEFIVNAGIGRADVVGTSHGGAVAMMLAARHPQRVRSLVLHAPANPFSLAGDPLVRFYQSPLGRWFAGQVPNLPTKLQELALGRMYGNSKLVREEALECYMSSLRVPGTVQHVLNMVNSWFDDMRALGAVLDQLTGIPKLLLWGTRDRAVTLESGRQLERILNAELVILPGAGHLPHEEVPTLFAGTVNGFLRTVEREGTQMRPHLVRP